MGHLTSRRPQAVDCHNIDYRYVTAFHLPLCRALTAICVTDTLNAAAQIIECMPLSDYAVFILGILRGNIPHKRLIFPPKNLCLRQKSATCAAKIV